MSFTRREFIRGGVSAFTFSFAAPAFLSDLARAQGTARRNLVVLYLSGGNDALSMVVPYTDAQYYARRPGARHPRGERAADRARQRRQRARPQSAADRAEDDLRLRPAGADPAHRLRELEPLAFPGHRHLGDGQHRRTRRARAGSAATSTRSRRRSIRWSAGRRCATCRTCCRRTGSASPRSRASPATRSPAERQHRDRGATFARQTRDADRVARSGRHAAPRVRERRRRSRRSRRSTGSRRSAPTARRSPIRTTASARRCRPIAGAMVNGVGTRVFFVQTGGYDTHAGPEHQPGQRRLHQPDGDAERRPVRVLQRPDAARGCSATRWSCSSRSSGAASARTAAPAPTTARRA